MPFQWEPATDTVRIGGTTYSRKALEALPKPALDAILAKADMMNRPYQSLTGSELSHLLAEGLEAGKPKQPAHAIEVTAFGDKQRSWLVDGAMSSTANVETTFRVGADGRPEAVTRLVDKPSSSAVRNAGETELAWLKRRVNEICWRPT